MTPLAILVIYLAGVFSGYLLTVVIIVNRNEREIKGLIKKIEKEEKLHD